MPSHLPPSPNGHLSRQAQQESRVGEAIANQEAQQQQQQELQGALKEVGLLWVPLSLTLSPPRPNKRISRSHSRPKKRTKRPLKQVGEGRSESFANYVTERSSKEQMDQMSRMAGQMARDQVKDVAASEKNAGPPNPSSPRSSPTVVLNSLLSCCC